MSEPAPPAITICVSGEAKVGKSMIASLIAHALRSAGLPCKILKVPSFTLYDEERILSWLLAARAKDPFIYIEEVQDVAISQTSEK